jgi:hypothetical protein
MSAFYCIEITLLLARIELTTKKEMSTECRINHVNAKNTDHWVDDALVVS